MQKTTSHKTRFVIPLQSKVYSTSIFLGCYNIYFIIFINGPNCAKLYFFGYSTTLKFMVVVEKVNENKNSYFLLFIRLKPIGIFFITNASFSPPRLNYIKTHRVHSYIVDTIIDTLLGMYYIMYIIPLPSDCGDLIIPVCYLVTLAPTGSWSQTT